MAPYLSIVIPVYNEASIVASAAAELSQGLEERGWDYEIIFAENGLVAVAACLAGVTALFCAIAIGIACRVTGASVVRILAGWWAPLLSAAGTGAATSGADALSGRRRSRGRGCSWCSRCRACPCGGRAPGARGRGRRRPG